jgi:hypothetical protein
VAGGEQEKAADRRFAIPGGSGRVPDTESTEKKGPAKPRALEEDPAGKISEMERLVIPRIPPTPLFLRM